MVTIESVFGSLRNPEVIQIVIRRNENSLICPKEDQARKLFFLVCHITHKISIVMNGLTIITNKEKIRICGR